MSQRGLGQLGRSSRLSEGPSRTWLPDTGFDRFDRWAGSGVLLTILTIWRVLGSKLRHGAILTILTPEGLMQAILTLGVDYPFPTSSTKRLL